MLHPRPHLHACRHTEACPGVYRLQAHLCAGLEHTHLFTRHFFSTYYMPAAGLPHWHATIICLQPLGNLQFSRKTAQNRPPSGLWGYTLYPASASHICPGSASLHPPAAHPMNASLPTTNHSLLALPPPYPSSSPPTLQAPSCLSPPYSCFPLPPPSQGTPAALDGVRASSPSPPASRLPSPTAIIAQLLGALLAACLFRTDSLFGL